MSLGTRTMGEIDGDRQPLSTADSDLRLSLGFLDSGLAGNAAVRNSMKRKQMTGK